MKSYNLVTIITSASLILINGIYSIYVYMQAVYMYITVQSYKKVGGGGRGGMILLPPSPTLKSEGGGVDPRLLIPTPMPIAELDINVLTL